MGIEGETVAEIVRRVRRDCNAYPLPTAAAEMLKLVREIEAAHGREVESYKRLLMTSQCALEDEIIKNKNLSQEVAELRECLLQACTDVCLKCVRNSRNVVCSKGRECEHVKRWGVVLEEGK